MVLSFRFIAVVGGLIVTAYVINLVLPEKWRWLSPSDLDHLKDLTISILSGVAVNLALRVAHDD